jgi:ribosome biogenesis GTPase / thiamine phosphate phosphatase
MTTDSHGIVISRHGKEVLIEDVQGARHRCITRTQLDAVISGDRILWQPQAQGYGSIVKILPRHGELHAISKTGKPRVVAANIDILLIVCAAQPPLQVELLDHYLIAAEIAAIQPIILFNKIDLLKPDERSAAQNQLVTYQTIGYRVEYLSVNHSLGLDALRQDLAGKTAVLVGQSGVGKSSLLRALVPGATARIGELSTEQGKHTTSHSELYHLPNGGYVIDSPGVRSFNFIPVDAATLAQAFIEFRPYLGQCRFANCSHVHEPGCAIKQAVSAQHITQVRYHGYQAMLVECRT